MKRYYRDLLLNISIFFFAFAFAEELQCCSDKSVYVVHKERPVIRVTRVRRAHGSLSQMSRARGASGGGSLIRPTGKKNRSMSSMTKSASLAVLHVTVAILFHLLFY